MELRCQTVDQHFWLAYAHTALREYTIGSVLCEWTVGSGLSLNKLCKFIALVLLDFQSLFILLEERQQKQAMLCCSS